MKTNMLKENFLFFKNACYQQRWGITLITTITTLAAFWFATTLPNSYKASANLTTEPIKIPAEVNSSKYELNRYLFSLIEEKAKVLANDAEHLSFDAEFGHANTINSIRLSFISRDKEAAELYVNRLLSDLSNSVIKETSVLNTLKVLNTSDVSISVIKPRRNLILGLGFFSGLFLGSFLALLFELIRLRFR